MKLESDLFEVYSVRFIHDLALNSFSFVFGEDSINANDTLCSFIVSKVTKVHDFDPSAPLVVRLT